MECDDVQKTYDELCAKGAEFAKPPKTEPWGVSAILKDSEGNQIVLSTSR
jgi:predicted enzyme related to lactoylglutathione lyase